VSIWPFVVNVNGFAMTNGIQRHQQLASIRRNRSNDDSIHQRVERRNTTIAPDVEFDATHRALGDACVVRSITSHRVGLAVTRSRPSKICTVSCHEVKMTSVRHSSIIYMTLSCSLLRGMRLHQRGATGDSAMTSSPLMRSERAWQTTRLRRR
jgi:hypothetical protein